MTTRIPSGIKNRMADIRLFKVRANRETCPLLSLGKISYASMKAGEDSNM